MSTRLAGDDAWTLKHDWDAFRWGSGSIEYCHEGQLLGSPMLMISKTGRPWIVDCRREGADGQWARPVDRDKCGVQRHSKGCIVVRIKVLGKGEENFPLARNSGTR